MARRVPVAWLQLTSDRVRLVAAIAGIAFAAMLVLVQLGFKDALYDSATLVHDHLNFDLALVSPQYQYLIATRSFSEDRLYRALAIDGVASVTPVYVSLASWINPDSRRDLSVLIVGFRPQPNVFRLAGVDDNLTRLQMPDVVVADLKTRPEFGALDEAFTRHRPVVTEVNGRRVTVGGVFELGTGFAVSGTLITSDLNFLRIVRQRRAGMIDIGLIALGPGADAERVRSQLAADLPPDVRVLTRREFVDLEKAYWLRTAPVGFIFNLGAVMGLFVGAVIVYQILLSDVSDHLPEYATLKAMGYSDGRLFAIVLREALMLSVFGFLPGLAIAWGLYELVVRTTFLPMVMTIDRALVVLALTMLMCCSAAALAMRKLRAADPAEIF
jgi:putative ABC transport system permease protein